MDAFTMLVLACVSGEATCTASRISDMDFTNAESCEARIDDITKSMTKQLAMRPDFKGKEVTYDVSCLSKAQLWQRFGIAQSDT